jgi:hypothetical protein
MLSRQISKFVAQALVDQEASNIFVQSIVTENVLEVFGFRCASNSPTRLGLPRRGCAAAYTHASSIWVLVSFA